MNENRLKMEEERRKGGSIQLNDKLRSKSRLKRSGRLSISLLTNLAISGPRQLRIFILIFLD